MTSKRLYGPAAGLASLLVAAAVLLPFRDDLDTATVALVFVLPGVAAALAGGRWAALVTAVAAGVALNVGFLRPYGTLKVDLIDEVINLIVFCGVALLTAASPPASAIGAKPPRNAPPE